MKINISLNAGKSAYSLEQIRIRKKRLADAARLKRKASERDALKEKLAGKERRADRYYVVDTEDGTTVAGPFMVLDRAREWRRKNTSITRGRKWKVFFDEKLMTL